MTEADSAHTTRRALFAGAAALTAAASPAVALAAHPDADMLVLAEERRRLDALIEAKEKAVEHLYDVLEETGPKRPAALYVQTQDWHCIGTPMAARIGNLIWEHDMERVRQNYGWHRGAFEQCGVNKSSMDRAAAVIAAWEDWFPRYETFKAAIGIDAANAEIERHYDAIRLVEAEIVATKAGTLAGMKVKAEVLAHFSLQGARGMTSVKTDAFASLMADLGVVV